MARKDRTKPTQYRPLPFHIIRSVQLVSSAIVASILSYFLFELQRDHYRLPWTFLLLLAVSLLTVLSLAATIVLHCLHGLSPLLNTLLNTLLAVLWTVSFSLLAWWSSGTLTHVCNKLNWDDETGISICRTYKALFSFSLLGVLSTVLALALDLYTQRSTTRRGRFTQLRMGDQKKDFDGDGIPELFVGGPGREFNPNPSAGRHQTRPRGGEGYAVPEEQHAYDDTSYQGAGGQMGRRSLETRV